MAAALVLQWPRTAATRPGISAGAIVTADLLALTASVMAAAAVRQIFDADYALSLYYRLWPFLGLFVIVYSMMGLYPGLVTSTIAEVRKISSATTLVFLLGGALSFLLRDANVYSRSVFLFGWLAALILVPVGRSLVRSSFARTSWWGYPVVVFGTGEMAERVVSKLLMTPECGLRPAAVFDPTGAGSMSIGGVPVFHGIDRAALFANGLGISRAIIAAPGSHISQIMKAIESQANVFTYVTIIPDMIGLSNLGIQTRDICRMLGLELRRSLLLPGPRLAKRVIDLTLASLASVACIPVFALIALIIKLDSHGPVFYGHRRLGHRSPFTVWKFRTMLVNGASLLSDHFKNNPEHLAEWEQTQKLRNDPRLTRVGRLLRRTSLDELPQLWNIIRGDMSLVGPRPIVDNEVTKYGENYDLYRQVPPGLTGLWQVSGRNNTTYEERVELDTYYIRNWSPWIDVYLLVRTIQVVLRGQGAY